MVNIPLFFEFMSRTFHGPFRMPFLVEKTCMYFGISISLTNAIAVRQGSPGGDKQDQNEHNDS